MDVDINDIYIKVLYEKTDGGPVIGKGVRYFTMDKFLEEFGKNPKSNLHPKAEDVMDSLRNTGGEGARYAGKYSFVSEGRFHTLYLDWCPREIADERAVRFERMLRQRFGEGHTKEGRVVDSHCTPSEIVRTVANRFGDDFRRFDPEGVDNYHNLMDAVIGGEGRTALYTSDDYREKWLYAGLFTEAEMFGDFRVPEGWKRIGNPHITGAFNRELSFDNELALRHVLDKDSERIGFTRIYEGDGIIALYTEGHKAGETGNHVTLAVAPGVKPVTSLYVDIRDTEVLDVPVSVTFEPQVVLTGGRKRKMSESMVKEKDDAKGNALGKSEEKEREFRKPRGRRM